MKFVFFYVILILKAYKSNYLPEDIDAFTLGKIQ